MQQLEQQYGEGNSKDGPDVNKQPDKIDVLFDALNDIDYLLSTIGGPTFFLSVYIFSLFISLIDFGSFFRTVRGFSLCPCLHSHFGAYQESSQDRSISDRPNQSFCSLPGSSVAVNIIKFITLKQVCN